MEVHRHKLLNRVAASQRQIGTGRILQQPHSVLWERQFREYVAGCEFIVHLAESIKCKVAQNFRERHPRPSYPCAQRKLVSILPRGYVSPWCFALNFGKRTELCNTLVAENHFSMCKFNAIATQWRCWRCYTLYVIYFFNMKTEVGWEEYGMTIC